MSSNSTCKATGTANPTCSTSSQNTNSQNTCNATNEDASKNTSCEYDLYGVLHLKPTASQEEVEKAYKKLASEWYPERKNDNRAEAQKKFNSISHAFAVLSDPARRNYYDQLAHKKFSKEDALNTFQKFFHENDILEEEQEFFKKNKLLPHNNFYQTLGVQKNATGQQIRDAFRKLSLENNPKNKPGCNETEHKFKEMCEAYNTLSNDKLRQNYDRLISSELPSELAYEQFNSTFGHGHFQDEKDEKALGKIVRKASQKQELEAKHHHKKHHPQQPTLHHDTHANLQKHHHPFPGNYSASQEITQEIVTKKGPHGTTTKKVTHKSSSINGKKTATRIEETTNPDGTQDVVETIEDHHGKKVNEYQIKEGKKMPKAIKS